MSKMSELYIQLQEQEMYQHKKDFEPSIEFHKEWQERIQEEEDWNLNRTHSITKKELTEILFTYYK